jgi:hypothetical protein
VTSASVLSTSDGLQLPETVTHEVDLQLLGCDILLDALDAVVDGIADIGAGRTLLREAGSNTQPDSSAVGALLDAMLDRPSANGMDLPGSNSGGSSSGTSPPAAPYMSAPPGVFMAAEGSVLCGGRTVCSAGQRCLDDAVCCAPGSSNCGGSCCPFGNVCLGGSRCMKPGSQLCGAGACGPGQSCLAGRCCDAATPVCGSTCCDAGAGEICVLGQCLARGSSACGSTACGPGQQVRRC